MRRALVGLFALLLAAPVDAQSWRLIPGTRIRVSTPTGQVTGVVTHAGSDSLVVTPARGASLVLRQSDVQGIEMRAVRSRLAGAGAGAFWGAAMGGVLGAIAGSIPVRNCDRPSCPRPSAEETGMLGAFTSIWLGAIVGAIRGRDVWVPMTLQLGPATEANDRPTVGVQLTVRF